MFLVALAVLLLLRPVFYQLIGGAVDWRPKLDLFLVVLNFSVKSFSATLAFSVFSFVRLLVLFYFWLLFLNLVTPPAADRDPIQKMIQLQLGLVAGWPRWLQALLPILILVPLWAGCQPLLAWVGVVGHVHSTAHLIEQGLLLGVSLWLSLKVLIPAFLLTYLIISYVYLGQSPLWDFVNATSRHLLAPLAGLPLRLGRIDLAPVVGIVIALVVLDIIPNAILAGPHLERRDPGAVEAASHSHWVIWPQ